MTRWCWAPCTGRPPPPPPPPPPPSRCRRGSPSTPSRSLLPTPLTRRRLRGTDTTCGFLLSIWEFICHICLLAQTKVWVPGTHALPVELMTWACRQRWCNKFIFGNKESRQLQRLHKITGRTFKTKSTLWGAFNIWHFQQRLMMDKNNPQTSANINALAVLSAFKVHLEMKESKSQTEKNEKQKEIKKILEKIHH